MSDQKYLIVNTGSASKKYALYAGNNNLFKIHLEKEAGNFVATLKIGAKEEKLTVSENEYKSAITYVLELLLSQKIISDKNEISAVGIRVVAPGEYFLSNKIIDSEYLTNLEKAKAQAPLHINPVLAELEQLKNNLPDMPVFGVSDSAFHKTMPNSAKLYALPEEIASKLGIYRFGYHGISARSVLRKIENVMGDIPPRIIICHLGSGSTITAVKNSKSVDTSMGFTPLEGLPMGTRIGNIDAGAVVYLAQNLQMNLEELETFFNSKCGLLGLSGRTSDVRELIELEKTGDPKAKIALNAFTYAIKKYIGAYTAALGGLDLLVFTATIGERSFIIRSRICEGLEGLGIILDQEKNEKTVSTDDSISDKASPVKIAVITTDETGEITKETQLIS